MKTKKKFQDKYITYLLLVVMFAVALVMVKTGTASRKFQSWLVPICVNIILAVSLNLTIGFLGELTLGHAGFMSVGAYAGCLFSQAMADILPTVVRFPLAMLVGGLTAAIFGVLVGIPVLRLKGDYLAIVTLAFGEIIRSVIINLNFTGGAAGLKGTPQDSNFYIAFAVVMITVILITNLTESGQGRSIKAIRDNRIAAEACGINVTYYRLLAFVFAAFFAGIAGVIYGHNLSILNAGTFDYNKSIEILVLVVLGGLGSIRGSVISATILYVLPELLRPLADYRMIIYSIVLIVIMILNSSEQFKSAKDLLNVKNALNHLKGKKNAKEEVSADE